MTLNSDLGLSSVACWHDVFWLEGLPQNLTCIPNRRAGNSSWAFQKGQWWGWTRPTISSRAAHFSAWFSELGQDIMWTSMILPLVTWLRPRRTYSGRGCTKLGSKFCFLILSPDTDLLCGPGHVIKRLSAFAKLLMIYIPRGLGGYLQILRLW